MTTVRTTVRSGLCLFALLLTPIVLGGAPTPQNPPQQTPKVDAAHLRMQPEDLPLGGRVFGDPSAPGMYVIRNRFAPGATSRPHFHNQDRYVTVIKGTWWTGEGDVFKPETMVPIKAGGFMFHPAGLHHYDGARDEEVIVQIMGLGPVETTQTEVDEAGRRTGR